MKRILVIVIIIIFSIQVIPNNFYIAENIGYSKGNSGTKIDGTISSDTIWSKTNSPYIIEDNVNVEKNTTLIIEPGVVVSFEPSSHFFMNGKLIAIGTPELPIIFSQNKTIDLEKINCGLDFTLHTSPETIVEYCIFENLFYGIRYTDVGFNISNCKFKNVLEGIVCSPDNGSIYGKTSAKIFNNSITCGFEPNWKNSVGIEIKYSTAIIKNNNISGFDVGIVIDEARNVTIVNNSIFNNNFGIYLEDDYGYSTEWDYSYDHTNIISCIILDNQIYNYTEWGINSVGFEPDHNGNKFDNSGNGWIWIEYYLILNALRLEEYYGASIPVDYNEFPLYISSSENIIINITSGDECIFNGSTYLDGYVYEKWGDGYTYKKEFIITSYKIFNKGEKVIYPYTYHAKYHNQENITIFSIKDNTELTLVLESPDLTLIRLNVSNFTDIKPDNRSYINVTAYNRGNIGVSNVNVKCYVDNKLLDEKIILALNENLKVNLSFVCNLSSADHIIKIVIDENNQINEFIENNNEIIFEIKNSNDTHNENQSDDTNNIETEEQDNNWNFLYLIAVLIILIIIILIIIHIFAQNKKTLK